MTPRRLFHPAEGEAEGSELLERPVIATLDVVDATQQSDASAAVTGGTKGMGRAIALTMAAEGAKVAVLARDRASGGPDAEAAP